MSPTIETHLSIEGYFEELLRAALAAERLSLSDEASSYVLRLLSDFSQAESLFAGARPDESGTPALFRLYERAINAPPSDRFDAFRSLGDVALIVSGFFAAHLERSLVGKRYYVDMGGSGYLQAATLSPGSFRSILEQLSAHFRRLVEVLTRIAEQTTLPVQADLGALYERWAFNPDSPELSQRLMNGFAVPVFGKVKVA